MSIRTAIATALVKHHLTSEADMYMPRGILIVGEIVNTILLDANRDVDQVDGIVASIAKAIDPYGIDGSQVAAKTPSPREVLTRLAQLGVIVVIDAQARNFNEPVPCPITSSITDSACLLPFGHDEYSPTRFHKFTATAAEQIHGAVVGAGGESPDSPVAD